jgi:hypothetical protein
VPDAAVLGFRVIIDFSSFCDSRGMRRAVK